MLIRTKSDPGPNLAVDLLKALMLAMLAGVGTALASGMVVLLVAIGAG